MPKLVKELPQGKAFSRSAEGGTLADTATRVWKIVLNAPNESFDLSQAIGVQIGDALDSVNQIPCVSIDVKGDGESRMVRIVTAQYRSSPMVDGEGGTGLPDPMLVMPDLRPANFSTSTSLYEMPARFWVDEDGKWSPARNPIGEFVEGVTKLEPITTIRITQFEFLPGIQHQRYVGYVNSNEMSLGSLVTFPKHTVMFRGVESQPHVETFGTAVVRGFMNSYEFAFRLNEVDGYADGDPKFGWNMAIVVEGYDCKTFDPAAPRADQDPFRLPLKEWKFNANGQLTAPLKLIDGVKFQPDPMNVRAMTIVGNENSAKQNPCAMPVCLNEDGTPRKIGETRAPLIWKRRTQKDINLVDTLRLRVG